MSQSESSYNCFSSFVLHNNLYIFLVTPPKRSTTNSTFMSAITRVTAVKTSRETHPHLQAMDGRIAVHSVHLYGYSIYTRVQIKFDQYTDCDQELSLHPYTMMWCYSMVLSRSLASCSAAGNDELAATPTL